MKCPEYDAAPIDEYGNTHVGACHLCHRGGVNIACCHICQHWFCYDCRYEWWDRAWSAVKYAIMIFTRKNDKGECCGP